MLVCCTLPLSFPCYVIRRLHRAAREGFLNALSNFCRRGIRKLFSVGD